MEKMFVLVTEKISNALRRIKNMWKWKNLFLIICLSYLPACISVFEESHKPTLPELTNLVVSANQWNQCFPGLSDKCVEQLTEFRFVKVGPERLANLCGQCFAGKCNTKIAGCFLRDNYGFVFDQNSAPTILYLDGVDLAAIVRHEFSHYASECTWDDLDSSHSNKDVWDFADDGGTCAP